MHDEPVIRIVRGSPTAEEVAALLGVLSLRRAEAPAPAGVSRWAGGARPVGRTWRPGPDAWRTSALPSPR
ncbi:MAG: acyl-CoA carboxylase subunit epsilon [Micromonosporaceae bacterium]